MRQDRAQQICQTVARNEVFHAGSEACMLLRASELLL